jgi:hypothetical protein
VLRKHRDVIFDIKQGDNKVYTVQATDSDFYNSRDKKLIYAKQNGTVTFKDGERLVLRVSRGFKGALVLKSAGVVLLRVEPNELDKHRNSENPKEKPAPIIIAMGKATTPSVTSAPAASEQPAQKPISQSLPSSTLKPVSAHIDEYNIPAVCVVDGSAKDMPAELLEYFKKGGGAKTGFADIDPNHVMTRNWIWGQVAGTVAYGADNWEWLRASIDGKTHQGFKLVKARVHYVRGKVRFYFSGYSNANTVFGRGGHGPAHDRIMTIFAGLGETESMFKSAGKAILGSLRGNALVSFFFGSATAIAEWKDDVKKDGYDFAAAMFTTLIKTIVVVALTALVIAILGFFVMLLAGMTVPILVIGAVTIGFGLLANYFIEAEDKHIGQQITGQADNMDGTASVIAPWIREQSKHIQASWLHLMEKFPNDFKAIAF